MATEEQVSGSWFARFAGDVNWDRVGQRLTITDRIVSKLSFKTRRVGTLTSTITMTIRKVSDDSIIISKEWGSAANVSDTAEWIEATFDTQVLVNEQVRILMEWSGTLGDVNNYLEYWAVTPSAKSGEQTTRYFGSYTDTSVYDATYRYTYESGSTAAASVTTQAASSVDKTTATGNGNVTNLGTPEATQHGHVLATHTNPTTDDNKTEKGVPIDDTPPAETGAFTSSITDLVPNTFYFYRAYIYYNSEEVFYGIERSFTTDPDVPVVTTNPATSVATTTALGNGSIDNNGGSALTELGVCWVDDATYDGGAHPPTTADDKTTEVATNGATAQIGKFDSSMTVLSADTLYHYKAYAINTSEGTGYGVRQTFTTLVAGAPIVVTRATINVRTTTATGVGNIVSLGGDDVVTQHGHVLVTKASFDTSGSPTIDGGTNFGVATELGTGAVGAFASDIENLTDGTTYYIRAYAANSYGTAYGNNDIIYPTSVFGATRGHLTVLGEHLAYTARSGKRRAILGRTY